MYPPIYLEYCFHEYQRDLHHNTGFSLPIFLSDIDLIQDQGDLDHSSIFTIQTESGLVSLWPSFIVARTFAALTLGVSIVGVFVCMQISKTSSVCIITVYHVNMHIKHQFDRYPKTDFQGHLIHVCPILNLPIYFVRRGGVGGVRSNEEDRQLVIFFITILFIHYLPKNKTPFVEMVYQMYKILHFFFPKVTSCFQLVNALIEI